MERRDAIRALGLAAAPALLMRAGSAAAAPAPLPRAAWLLQTLQYGTVAKRISEIALTRSTTASVVDFAQQEIIEQKTAAIVLTSNPNPTPPALTPAQQAIIGQMLTTTTVDFTFISLQISGHEELRRLQSAYLEFDSNLGQATVGQALLLRSNVHQHLLLLRAILAGTV